MMTTMKRQAGGMYNVMFLLAVIGGGALLAMVIAPIYMNEAKATKIVSQTAKSPQNYELSQFELRKGLQRRWDVDDVKHLKVNDVKIKKSKNGKALAYKYEVREHLFANWDLVLTFDKEYPMVRGGG
ncbi:MAG: DUF4845 domain-containing protein [Oceanococcus sp.]|nr:MAG: DUF4845 domain-containing protein [Oceanococcus sp.]